MRNYFELDDAIRGLSQVDRYIVDRIYTDKA